VRAVLAIVLTFLLALAGWIGAIRAFTLPSIQIEWVKGIYAVKEAAAARITEPKIVIIGGSAVHYGFSAEAVARATGIPTVNLGTHAGLGPDYLFDRAQRSLKPGDWAVVALEPQLYAITPPGVVLSEQVLRNDLGYLLHAPSLDAAVRILFGLSPLEVFQTQVRRSIPWTSPLARASSVSAWGDETLELSKLSQPYMLNALETSKLFPPVMLDPKDPPPFLKKLFAWAKANDIQVAGAWVPLLMRPEYKEEPYLSYFAALKAVFAEAGGVSLGTATDYFQPIENMFDFVLHDNEFGRARASAVLAREICKVRVCPSALPPAGRAQNPHDQAKVR
jgi:hypothetical protein